MVELDGVELRVMLAAALDEALELADDLARLVAAGELQAAARTAANYLQARSLVRRLRSFVRVETAG